MGGSNAPLSDPSYNFVSGGVKTKAITLLQITFGPTEALLLVLRLLVDTPAADRRFYKQTKDP